MRKNISFTVAATILGLSMMLWAKSAVVATQVDVVRPPVGASGSCRHLQFISANSDAQRNLLIDGSGDHQTSNTAKMWLGLGRRLLVLAAGDQSAGANSKCGRVGQPPNPILRTPAGDSEAPRLYCRDDYG